VLFTSIRTGRVDSLDDFFVVCNIISRGSQYKFCPGWEEKSYCDQCHDVICYHVSGIRRWEKPFNHIDSETCLLWHQLTKNASKEDKLSNTVMFRNCKCLSYNLDHQKQRSIMVSPSRRIARQQPSSSFKL